MSHEAKHASLAPSPPPSPLLRRQRSAIGTFYGRQCVVRGYVDRDPIIGIGHQSAKSSLQDMADLVYWPIALLLPWPICCSWP
jgi:hypothetical protein